MNAFRRLPALLGLGLLLLSNLPAAGQDWTWARPASTQPNGAVTTAATTATAITAGGDVYSAYRHNGPLTLGNTTYPANGQQDNAVLAHHDQNGNVTGALMVLNAGLITDLHIDATGALYASGRFGGEFRAGGQTYPVQGASDFFIAKFDTAGTLLWFRQISALTQFAFGTMATGITTDAAGNVTLGADFTGTVVIPTVPNSTQLTAASQQLKSLMLVQYDSAGNFRWAKSSANVGVATNFGGLAAAPDGTLHVVGTAFGGFSWDSLAVNTTSLISGFWLKVSNAGTGLDAERFGSNGQGINSPRVATDQLGLPYVAVNAYGPTLNWGPNTFAMPAGSQNGFYVAGLNPNGVPRWVRSGSLRDSSFATLSSLKAVTDLNDGNNVRLYLGGNFMTASSADVLQYGPFRLSTPGFRRGTDGFVLALDGSTGTANWLIPAVKSNGADYLDALSANAAGQLSVGGVFTGDTAYFGNIRVNNVASQRWSAYTAKLLQSYNLAQGTVFTDANANSALDSGEFGKEGVIVEAQPGNLVFSTGSSGQYDAVLDLSNYTFSVPNPPLYYTAVPAGPTTAAFTTFGNLSTGHDIALQPTGPSQDLRVNLTPVGRARPGFTLTYRVTYRNVGTVPMTGGAVQLDFASALTYLSSSQAVTQTGNILSWPYGTLQPGEVRNADLLFQIPTTAPLGSTLVSTAAIDPLAGDLTPADNAEQSAMTVTGSYDPNDIRVNYDLMTPSQVQRGDWLEYLVRFENMGTDTAFTVLLHDTLPAQSLRLNTLQLIATSHNCMWGLKPNGLLAVRFPNINLPHRNANPIRSQGFVRFRVRPEGSLVIGDVIPNQAAIFFDFNAPISTNVATTEVNQANGLPDAANALPGSVWPNPASGTLHVAADTRAAATLTLLDATGRAVLTHTTAATDQSLRAALDVRGLPTGLYLLRTQAGARAFTRRVVLR